MIKLLYHCINTIESWKKRAISKCECIRYVTVDLNRYILAKAFPMSVAIVGRSEENAIVRKSEENAH